MAKIKNLYIGKSVHIKSRVLSHFSARYRHPKELKLFNNTQAISYEQTNGEFGALLLESQLIKKFRPIFNRRLRTVSHIYAIHKSKNNFGYSTLDIKKVSLEDFAKNKIEYFGLYRGKRYAKHCIEKTVKSHSLCGILSSIESGKGPCFLYQLGQCHGACLGKESHHSYNQRLSSGINTIQNSDWPYQSAIAIEERGDISKIKWHVFDNWCYLGSATTLSSAMTMQFENNNIINDIDASKYLSSYIKKNKGKGIVVIH